MCPAIAKRITCEIGLPSTAAIVFSSSAWSADRRIVIVLNGFIPSIVQCELMVVKMYSAVV